MADIFNFAQKGLGKLVGFGKKGPRLEAENQDGNFRVATYNGYTEVQVHGANATVADSLLTKAQLDYTYGEGVLNIVTTEVSYTDGNVALFEAPADSMVFSITVDVPSSWVNATNSTSISIGDSAGTDNLFGAGESDLTQTDKFSSQYRKIYDQASNVTAYVNADGATSGTATITCAVLLEAAASKAYVSMGGGLTGIGGIGTYVAPDPVISGTSNNTIVSSSNGTAITSSGSSYVSLQNLPSYLDGNPMVTDINNGTVSWNIPATTVYMVRNDEWNAVSTTGWTLKDGDADILTNQTSGNVQVYQKDFTPGVYDFDDDSAIYFFDYSTTYAPTTQEIDATTEINIFFDSSGSMDSTLSPLETMRDGVLRTALEPFYDNNSDSYNAAVTITSVSTERVFDQLATMGSSNATRVINLVFADENSPYAAVTTYPATPNTQLASDIAALRSAVSSSNSSEGTDYYRSILFQINTGPNYFSGFKQMTQAVYNGTGNYSGTAGLSDFNETQTFLINDVQAAGNATFYANQIIAGLNSLGYDLDELSYTSGTANPTKFMVGTPYRDDGSVYDAGSAYIYNLDGTGEVQLFASDSDTSALFGSNVAMSASKVAVAAQGDNSNEGAVYVYNLDGTSEVKITASNGASGDSLGGSLAMTSTKIIAGATGDDDEGTQSGSAFIFDLDGTNEVQLTASDGAAQSYFGISVAICATKAAVGAYEDDSGKGAVYVYNLDGTSEQKITASDKAADDHFGETIAMTDTKLAVGSLQDDSVGANNTGSVYVYNLDGTGEVKITASDSAAADRFGYSIAMSGTKIVVGTINHNNSKGAVYVYNLDGTGEVKITASDGATQDYFGSSVAIQGSKIIVGALGKSSVYTYNLDGTGQQQFTDPDGSGEQFGRSVAFL